MKPCIIALVGPVGAGKSTQITQLLSLLNKNGTNASKTVLKRGHLLTRILEVTLARLLLKKGQDSTYPIEVIIKNNPEILKNLFNLFLILDALSVFCRFILTIYLPKKFGCIVVVEEYLQATIADYIWLSEKVNVKQSVFFPKLLACFAHYGGPFYTIFLDAPDDVLKMRCINRRSPAQSVEYLDMQRNLLFNISKDLSSSFL